MGGGGGGAKDYNYARTHITSAKSEVPFGRDPGPLSGPWKLYGFSMLSSAI